MRRTRDLISRVPASFGDSPSSRWTSRSLSVHSPATVGRSWVVIAASACAGYRDGGGLLEPEQPVRQDVAGGERETRVLFDRAEIFANNHRVRPLALERDDREQIAGMAVHVRAVPRVHSCRDPEQPEQAHHVIDAQAAGVPEARADRLDERLVAGGAQPVRHERRQAPVLSARVELVWRRADADAVGEHILERPGVGAAGVEPDRQVLHHRHRRRRARQLPVDLVLQPLVEPDPLAQRPAAGGARDAGRRRDAGDRPAIAASWRRTSRPGRRTSRTARDRAVRGGTSRTRRRCGSRTVRQTASSACDFSSNTRSRSISRSRFKRLRRARQLADAVGGVRPVDFLDAQVERTAETAARREVRDWPAAAASAPRRRAD